MGNRIIKFRAWDKINNEMVSAYVIDQTKKGGTEINANLSKGYNDTGQKTFYLHDVELMQFTGLHDKNGVEIYEGDILAYPSAHPKHKGKIFNNVVEFASGQTICGWRMRNKSCIVKATRYKFAISEIIGNIHQTPDLL